MRNKRHTIEIKGRVLTPDDGLIVGNGELSVSVYQTDTEVVWRFGKPDVWDRRIDRSEDPSPPPHIDEIARGIKDEGWTCPSVSWDGNDVRATKGAADEKRMKEICVGSCASYEKRPTPCPKPVGELRMHLPPDFPELEFRQTLFIEENRIEIVCSAPSGEEIRLNCFVAAESDLLCVSWETVGIDGDFSFGRARTIWFTLLRHPDPTSEAFAAAQYIKYRVGLVPDRMRLGDMPPLPAPEVISRDGRLAVSQSFYPDLTYPDGFACVMTPVAPDCAIEKSAFAPAGYAVLEIMPGKAVKRSGKLYVSVSTSTEKTAVGEPDFERELKRNLEKSAEFWASSSLSCEDKLIEQVWYETLHLRRCILMSRTCAPGLFFPSSLRDYTHWHGDYHMNYNLQQPYWSSSGANHPELLESYFKAVSGMAEIGEKIARDYYGCRGTFIQLTGYPMTLDDDPFGIAPLGRMAYMTGWATVLFREYWLYTRDIDFLRNRAYPIIKACALFYLDFMKKEEDGLYHIFPSCQGEAGFDGVPEHYRDREQVMEYARYALRAAADAGRVLGVDGELREAFEDRAENSAGAKRLSGRAKIKDAENPPEFKTGDVGEGYRDDPKPWPMKNDYTYEWYFGHYPYHAVMKLRAGVFKRSDFELMKKDILRWRRKNGALCAMSVENYGHIGGWSEGLGVLAPVQETLLQSWDGVVRLFPALPAETDAEFTDFRAVGAFLVSAKRKNAEIVSFRVKSLAGGAFSFENPYPTAPTAADGDGNEAGMSESEGAYSFNTEKGKTYVITKKK